jgi:hypothetical protein
MIFIIAAIVLALWIYGHRVRADLRARHAAELRTTPAAGIADPIGLMTLWLARAGRRESPSARAPRAEDLTVPVDHRARPAS